MSEIEISSKMRSFAQLLTMRLWDGKYKRDPPNGLFGIGWDPKPEDHIHCEGLSERTKEEYMEFLEEISRKDVISSRITLQHLSDEFMMYVEYETDGTVCGVSWGFSLSKKEVENILYSMLLLERRLYNADNEDIYERETNEEGEYYYNLKK